MINSRMLTWLLAITLMSVWLFVHGRISTDMTQFLPATSKFEDKLIQNQLQQGAASRLLIIALTGDDKTILADINKKLAEKLHQSDLFSRIENGEIKIDKNESDWLFKHRYLLSPEVKHGRFSTDSLRRAFQQRLFELQSPVPLVDKSQLRADPTAEFQSILKYWQADRSLKREQGVWFSKDGKTSFLLAETSAPAYKLKQQEITRQGLKSMLQETKKDMPVNVQITGGPVFALESHDTIERESRWFSLFATLAIILLLIWVYRSPGKVIISTLPIITAVITGASAVLLFYDSIHGITLVFGITIIGVVIDYPLHLYSHLTGKESAEKTMRRIAPTLLLGAMTTAIAYLAFVFTDFDGLAQLGVFAIAGIVSAATVTVWVLPGLLKMSEKPLSFTDTPDRFLVKIDSARFFLLPAMVVFISLVFYQNRPFPWQDDFAALSPLPEDLRKLDQHLRTQTGGNDTRYLLAVTGPEREIVQQQTESVLPRLDSLKQAKLLQGYDSAVKYLPSIKTQKHRQQFLPEKFTIKQELQHALENDVFRADAFLPFLKEIEQSRTLVPLTLENYTEGAVRWRLEKLLYKLEGQWISLIPLAGIRDIQPLQQIANGSVRLLDLKTAMQNQIADYRDTALRHLAWGSLAIILLLAVSLKNTDRTIRVLLTLVLAVAFDIAVLMLLAVSFSLFHLVAFLLVAGIGLDYALFLTRPFNDTDEKSRTLHAVLVCAVSTILVFGILSISQIPVLRAIGLTTAIGVAASLVTALSVTGFSKDNH